MKVSVRMFDLKPLHARWIVDMDTCLKQQKELILNGFDKAGITEAVMSTNKIFARIKILPLRNEQMKF